ncbi:twin-arginine translocase TatA/TatE family subunit [Curtobacterium herbarum]|uniref:Sec-independent protein translocase protein TatA n=1 Tax=Curtobacterium herbarum TaxID=150122 RepID=A0ABN1ZEY3_9MICO|nr:twin-arginine translocase TatA/TatE family subunit [Curtobacterium herbarum]MBM7476599.1 sec-independent protein translocase protein TatA [Curtobacterium herbarum]MCS6543839.1 twin-arginine translocase TatA/TatE family subunit [Curtobacterium herbarum]
MLQGLTGLHLVIILGIVLLLFGATKLPALAKGVGQSINIFKKEMETDDRKKPTTPGADATPSDATAYGATAQQAAPVQQPVVNPAPSVQPNNDSRPQ